MATDTLTCWINQFDIKTLAWLQRQNAALQQEIESTLSFNCCDKLLVPEKGDEQFQFSLYLHLGV